MDGGDVISKKRWHDLGAQGGQQAGLHSLPLMGGWPEL